MKNYIITNHKMSNYPRGTPLVHRKVTIKKLQPSSEYPYVDVDGAVPYNVILIARTDSRSEDNHMEVNNFHTGLVVTSLPDDAYLELIPHPTLYKSGYMLPGPIVIDNSTKSEIIVPLYKYKDVECLELPFPAVQILVKPRVPVFISAEEVKKPAEDTTFGYGPIPTVIYQAERGEPSYKGASKRGGSSKRGGNHMF
jgi:hypothetical protein